MKLNKAIGNAISIKPIGKKSHVSMAYRKSKTDIKNILISWLNLFSRMLVSVDSKKDIGARNVVSTRTP
jgi:hypothetical protein